MPPSRHSQLPFEVVRELWLLPANSPFEGRQDLANFGHSVDQRQLAPVPEAGHYDRQWTVDADLVGARRDAQPACEEAPVGGADQRIRAVSENDLKAQKREPD